MYKNYCVLCPTFPLNPKVRIELNDRLNVIGRHIARNNN